MILLENAVKYSVAGSPIEVETMVSGDEVHVYVSRTGA